MQIDDVAGLAVEPDHVHATGERLQVGVGSRRDPEGVHHVEGVFLAVEVQGLISSASAGLEVRKSGVPGGLDGGNEVGGEDASTKDRLKSISEASIHHGNMFLGQELAPVVGCDGSEDDSDLGVARGSGRR